MIECVRRGERSAQSRSRPRGRLRSPELLYCFAFGFFLLGALRSFAAEVIPPKPPGYFEDRAGVVSKEAALRFNEQLAQFERDTSNQIWMVVYPKMQSDSSIEDYTRRVAQRWGVGQKDRRNGAVLFVFVQDRKMYIQAGYGLEGALPDATCFDITEYQIKPRFRANDYEGGLAAGIDSIFKAIKGEYKGSGKTALEKRGQAAAGRSGFVTFIIFVVVLIAISRVIRRLGGYSYSSHRSGPIFFPIGGGGGGWSSGSGGGGFSGSLGGGGSFGGGGAGSSW